jgi:lipoprotein-releasing system permease protein
LPIETFIGGRYLRVKHKQSFISLITLLSIAGVMLGVMALIVVIAVMAGFESDLKSRILGVEAHLVLKKKEGPFVNYNAVIQKVEQLDGVIAAAPYASTYVILRSQTRVTGALLKGVDPKKSPKVIRSLGGELAHEQSVDVTTGKPTDTGIVLGKELARNLGVLKGDSIHVISPRGMLSPIGHIPSMKRFTVIGFFESGMYEFDGTLAFIPLKAAQKLMRLGEGVNGVEIRLADIYDAQPMSRRILKVLGGGFRIEDWMQMNRNLFSALKLEKAVMFIILALIVLVAAFNIASSLIMMVIEKTKDIAILKAMGATAATIQRLFIFNGLVIGFIGTFLGMISGVTLCILLKRYRFIELPGDVYYITTLPVQLDMLDTTIIGIAAIAICLLATLYPARQASRLNPVEAIRYG